MYKDALRNVLLAAAVAALVVGAAGMQAQAYPVVDAAASWSIAPLEPIPGVLEVAGPKGYFVQDKHGEGRWNTGLSSQVMPPPSFWFGSNFGMQIGYSGGSAGGAFAGSMSTMIQGVAGLYLRNLSDSDQSVSLSGTYSYSMDIHDSQAGTVLAPDGVARAEVGVSILVNGQNYFDMDEYINTVGSQKADSGTWQFTLLLAPHAEALMDAAGFAATKAISLEGSIPPLITDSLAPTSRLENPVPEPATLTLLVLGGLAMIRGRK